MAVGSISIHLWGDSVVAAPELGASATSNHFFCRTRCRRHRPRRHRPRRHRPRRHRPRRCRPRARWIMVSVVMMMMMMMGWGWLRAWAWLRAVAVGPILIAGRYAVITAPEFGSGTPTHFFLGIVRGWFRVMAATRVGR